MALGDLIRAQATNPAVAGRVFLRYDTATATFAEYHAESVRWANLFRTLHEDSPEPFHVGVLLDNIPDYIFALGGAALAGAVVVGINNTKRGGHLAYDIAYTDCRLLVAEQ